MISSDHSLASLSLFPDREIVAFGGRVAPYNPYRDIFVDRTKEPRYVPVR